MNPPKFLGLSVIDPIANASSNEARDGDSDRCPALAGALLAQPNFRKLNKHAVNYAGETYKGGNQD